MARRCLTLWLFFLHNAKHVEVITGETGFSSKRIRQSTTCCWITLVVLETNKGLNLEQRMGD